MDVCLMIEGQEGVSWPQWQALAQACERHGIPTLFRSDHYLNLDGQHPDRGSLDAWGTINALAAVTTTLRLGTLVSPASFRHPSVLGKLVVTADHVSGGRIDLGLGAGWHDREHAAYGLPVPAHRRARGRSGRAARDPDGDVGRRGVLVPGQALRPVRPGRPAQAGPATASAADHGRQRGPAQRRAGRPLRRRVQHAVPRRSTTCAVVAARSSGRASRPGASRSRSRP